METAFQPKDLQWAIVEGKPKEAGEAFSALTQWPVSALALDEDDPVLYAAVHRDGQMRGVCAYVNEDGELVIVPETDGPLFLGAPAELIEKLDITFSERAVRWRRDCLARHYRTMAQDAHIGHPVWTAFYSQTPLGVLQHNCHVGVLTGGAPDGMQGMAICDGHNWKTIQVPVEALNDLVPLWDLEWGMVPWAVLAMRGRSALHYVGVGPAEYRVGMLFNDMGGLLAWSPAASHCELMAQMAAAEETGFSRSMLLAQLNAWQHRSATVG